MSYENPLALTNTERSRFLKLFHLNVHYFGTPDNEGWTKFIYAFKDVWFIRRSVDLTSIVLKQEDPREDDFPRRTETHDSFVDFLDAWTKRWPQKDVPDQNRVWRVTCDGDGEREDWLFTTRGAAFVHLEKVARTLWTDNTAGDSDFTPEGDMTYDEIMAGLSEHGWDFLDLEAVMVSD